MMGFIEALPVAIASCFAIYLSMVDLKEMRIPNRILAIGLLVTVTTMSGAALYLGEMNRLLSALGGGLLSTVIFFMIHLVRPSGLGMGDVKFAGLIGATLSWISFPSGLIGLAIAFFISSLFSLTLLITRRPLDRLIPFAPFMSMGLVIVALGIFV